MPRIAIVLGSGLGDFVQRIEGPAVIPYGDLTGFPAPGVSGHEGALHVGRVAGTAVAVLAGRAHYYEEGRADAMRPVLETLKELGVRDLILTNAAGSLREDMPLVVCPDGNLLLNPTESQLAQCLGLLDEDAPKLVHDVAGDVPSRAHA